MGESDNTFSFPIHQEPENVHAALDTLFDVEEVTVNKRKVQRYMVATGLPPILQMFFQKQEFDNETKQPFLLDHHVKLEDSICMDRYMQTEDEELEEMRAKSRQLTLALAKEKRLQERYKTKYGGSPEILEETWQFISQLGEDLGDTESIQNDLKEVSDLHRKESDAVDARITTLKKERSALPFDKFDTAQNRYTLFAVFFHKGVDRHGHYWLYLRDFTKGIWRKYNDDKVTDVEDTEEIFRKSDPKTDGAPLFVVYVKDELKEQMLDPVHRQAPEPTVKSNADADVAMKDADALTKDADAQMKDADAEMKDGDVTTKDAEPAVDESELVDLSALVPAEDDPTHFYHG